MIPLTAWLVQLLSARHLAVCVSVGFLIASLLCSLAWSLESMILFRVLQDFTGGALIPLAFSMTLIKLPEHHRAKGMALFAITATFAPPSAQPAAAGSRRTGAGNTSSTSTCRPACSTAWSRTHRTGSC